MKNLRKAQTRAISSGEADDIDKLKKALYEQLFGVVNSIAKKWFSEDVEDITSDVFVKIFSLDIRQLKRILDNPVGYAAMVTRNHCVDLWRMRLRKENLHQTYEERTILNSRESDHRIADILNETILCKYLSTTQAQVILLRFKEDLEFCEIRTRLRLPSNNAVKMHLSRGIKKLRQTFCF